MKLGDDDALSAIDDKRALWGHEREFAHVNFLFFGRALVFITERYVERSAEGLTLPLSFESGKFWLSEFVADKVERRFVFKTKNREKLAEDRLQSHISALGDRRFFLEELVVGVDLQFDQVGWLDGLLKFAEVDAFRHDGIDESLALRSQRAPDWCRHYPSRARKQNSRAGRQEFSCPSDDGNLNACASGV